MKWNKIAFILMIFLLVGNQNTRVRGAAEGDTWVYLPVVMNRSMPSSIVIDHRHTNLSLIPAYWLNEAKTLTLHYAHTSHGGQVLEGITWLEGQNSAYGVAIKVDGTPISLPTETGVLRIYDGNSGSDTYIEPEDYWETLGGVERTRTVANTGLFGFSTWTWCGQQSYYSTTQVQLYLDTLNQFEMEYPAMRFIYMTGHTDGTQDEVGSVLARNNQMVRDYVLAYGKVLFDFADIESYDPNGTYYPNTSDACEWCSTWCNTHPADCASLPSYCAHSHPFNCVLKARAFWWMMARLAGWDGVTP